jgi:hypothetical protein
LLSTSIKTEIFGTTVLPTVVYGCETWSVKLREDHRLELFENKLAREVFTFTRDEVTEDWRRLHVEQLHNLYCSRNIIEGTMSRKLTRMGQVTARMVEKTFCWENVKT